MTFRNDNETLEVASLTARDAPVVAQRLASDPDGLTATGADAPHDETALARVIGTSIVGGSRLWRVRVGDDLFGAIVGDENYVLSIPEAIGREQAAPLLCAGITTYSPLKHWKVGPGQNWRNQCFLKVHIL